MVSLIYHDNIWSPVVCGRIPIDHERLDPSFTHESLVDFKFGCSMIFKWSKHQELGVRLLGLSRSALDQQTGALRWGPVNASIGKAGELGRHAGRRPLENGDMGVSVNGGAPKWMVYSGRSQSRMDDVVVALFQKKWWCLQGGAPQL